MRRGSGINKGTDPAVSKTSLRGEAGQAQASPGDFGEGCAQHESTQPLTLLPHKTRSKPSQQIQDLSGGQGGSRNSNVVWGRGCSFQGRGPWQSYQGMSGGGFMGFRGGSGGKTRKNQKKRSGTVWLATTQQHSGFCAGGSSRPNGSVYPLSVPAVAHPLPDFKIPRVQHATQSADTIFCNML